jgi:hypothetical protein
MSSTTYVVAWDEVMPTSLDISAQLSDAGLEYLVFDVSTDPQTQPNWVVAEKVRYFGHFYNSLVDFAKTDHEIFIWNAGDISGPFQAELTMSVERYMSKDEEIWLMAPSMINDDLPGTTTMIDRSKKYYKFMLALHLNGLWVALKRELALFILDFYEWMLKHKYMDFYKMISGHCLDTVYAAWTMYNNKKIYRDTSFTLTCGVVSSHDGSTAGNDCTTIKDKFADYIGTLGHSKSKIESIYEGIYSKFTEAPDTGWPLDRVYPNLDKYQGEFVY